jgi:serine/threonine protein kinase
MATDEVISRAIDVFERRGPEAYRHWLRRQTGDAEALDRQMSGLHEAGLLHAPLEEAEQRRLGRYRLLRRLGAGAMGVVYQAIDDALDRLVAIKVLAPAFAQDERMRERFRREARAIALLRHPGIVPVLEVGESEAEGELYTVLEYVEGTTLEEGLLRLRALDQAPAAVDAGTLKEAFRIAGGVSLPTGLAATAARWVGELADALAHAHAPGVVHRELKPSNAIVDESGRVRLLDFGLAQIAEDARMTQSADVLGTPQYLAPEVVKQGVGTADARVDVWSLGALLHELLTLRPAFEGTSAAQVLQRVLEQDPPPPSRVLPAARGDLDAIVAVALAKDRARRYSSAAELRDELERWLRDEPIHAREPSSFERLAVLAQRRPLVSALFVALVLLSSATTVVVLGYNARLRRESAQTSVARDGAEASLGFLQELLELSDVEELGPDTPASKLLEQGAARVREDARWQGQVLVRARLARTIGALAWGAGDLVTARELLGLANTWLSVPPPDATDPAAWSLERAQAANYLGNVSRASGDREGAVRHYRESLQALASRGRADVPARELEATLRANLADVQLTLGRYEEALADAHAALALCDGDSAEDRANRIWGDVALARILTKWNRTDEARAALERARDLARTDVLQPLEEAAVLDASAQLALEVGDSARAIEEFEAEAEIYRRLSGPRAAVVGEISISIGEAWLLAGEPQRARPLLEDGAAILLENGLLDHPRRSRALGLLDGRIAPGSRPDAPTEPAPDSRNP